MNIVLLSTNSSYHHLAQILERESSTVYHYGASTNAVQYGNYIPTAKYYSSTKNFDTEEDSFIDFIKNKKIDFVLSSDVMVARNERLHRELTMKNIPYFFPNPRNTDMEIDNALGKKLLNHLDIPTPKFQLVNGEYLFNNFQNLKRPFVIKLNFVYQYGKQTIIVNDDNYEEIFEDLFGQYLSGSIQINSNIDKTTSLIIEEYIEFEKEYSYYALFNKSNWQYFGSARNYKKINDGDRGFNTVGMGSYSLITVDNRVHEYVDKIYNFLKIYLKSKGNDFYRGFISFNIGIDKNNIPVIMGINVGTGNTDFSSILGTIKNNLSDLLYSASTDSYIPKIIHNDKSSVTIRVVNRLYNWLTTASFLPRFENIPLNIIQGIDTGPRDPEEPERELVSIKHSTFTTVSNSRESAADILYRYLDTQFIGQFMYRRDIGLLT